MNVLVTGGLGFIGTNLIPLLEVDARIATVTLLDNLCYTANPEIVSTLGTKFRFVQGDLCDAKTVKKLVSNVDLVIHLAAQTFVDNSIANPLVFTHTNVVGTNLLVDAMVRQKCHAQLLHVSTDEVFGETHDSVFTEISPYAPRNPYAASKAAADMVVRAYGTTYGLRYNIVHFANLYGPWQFPEKLIPKSILRLIRGEKVPIYGNGLQQRTWLHVEDAVRGLMQVGFCDHNQESFIIGSETVLTNIEVVKYILALLCRDESFVEYVPDRPGHDVRYAVDTRKARQILGWSAHWDFNLGLGLLVDWYRAHEEWLGARSLDQ